ncbi:MAG: DUF3343 domain-containing protein [Oscillospiraceae bacterium]|nr:DUF3343 domain-containing protein [Oscillospiraceae bacterium]
MSVFFVTFRSVTLAQRGERVLNRGKISSQLQRTPRWMEEQGCGYALRVRGDEAERAVQLLRENGIHFRKVYRQQGSAVEEAEL